MPSENDKLLFAYSRTAPVVQEDIRGTLSSAASAVGGAIATGAGAVKDAVTNVATNVDAVSGSRGAMKGGAAGGAATGATIGMLAGPAGALVGGAIGGVAGAAGGAIGAAGAPQYNRASVKMQEFLTGRGGGISQTVSGLIGPFMGTNMDELKATHAQQDTANWLHKKLIPLLQRHNNTLTVDQLENALKQIKLTEGGDAIDVTQITALKGFKNKAQVLDEDQLGDLITQISSQLQEIALTGAAARMNYEEYFNHISAHFQSSDISNMMIQYTIKGPVEIPGDPNATPPTEPRTEEIIPIFPPEA